MKVRSDAARRKRALTRVSITLESVLSERFKVPTKWDGPVPIKFEKVVRFLHDIQSGITLERALDRIEQWTILDDMSSSSGLLQFQVESNQGL